MAGRGEGDAGKVVSAAKAAQIVSEYEAGSIVGVGSGSTVKLFLDQLKRINAIDRYRYISTSYDTTLYLKRLGASNVETFICPPEIDVAVDGADEVDRELNLLKGGGGALFREKIVLRSSRRRIIIVDDSKLVDSLASRHPIPIEVSPFSLSYVIDRLKSVIDGEIHIRSSGGKLGPVITDNGNFIIDLKPRGGIENPAELDSEIRRIEGVLATGIFPYDGYEIIVGYRDGGLKILKS